MNFIISFYDRYGNLNEVKTDTFSFMNGHIYFHLYDIGWGIDSEYAVPVEYLHQIKKA